MYTVKENGEGEASSEILTNGFAGFLEARLNSPFPTSREALLAFLSAGFKEHSLKLTVKKKKKNQAVALKGLLGNSSRETNPSKNFFKMPFVGLLQFLIL